MTDQLSILPTRPDDISMDYDRLRAEGIDHLEQLASKIWTDFNVHDPGITMLEVLAYAITDLGYRANLPIEDLLAAGPDAGGKSFFSMEEVFPNRPWTAMDYRKLFIDVAGVKNAWVYKYYSRPGDAARLPPNAPENLNGLYEILLELPDGLTPDGKAAAAIVKKVRDRYYDNRNLGEDIQAIHIVRDCPFCLCLDLEIDPGMNEVDVLSSALFAIQEYLGPHPRFHSFEDMRDAGFACEDILQGPRLDHGFLPDSELDRSPYRRKIFRSDLIGIIMETPGVIAIKEMRWKKAAGKDGPGFSEEWCLDFNDCPAGPEGEDCEYFYQPFLDLCCSRFRVSRGAFQRELKEEDVLESLEWLQLERDIPVDRSLPRPPVGNYRPDLGDYESVQYEFPENYGLGDYELPVSADQLRRAQKKQLQAFLTFFDQLLAAYLQQLAGVRDLLSVNQDVELGTYAISALCEVPGMEDLVADFSVYEVSEEAVTQWIDQYNPPEAVAQKLNDFPADHPRRFVSTSSFELAMEELIGMGPWRQHGNSLKGAMRITAAADDFSYYCEAGQGSYFDGLAQLTETDNQRGLRRNRIMDHLLARFGESFSQYSLGLFATRVERENDPGAVDFGAYLEDKAAFLREIPTLAGDRGRGFNYRQKNMTTGAPEVWNTDNVAGLKKRVARLLGMDDYSARSLQCDPDYDLRIKKGESEKGYPNYRLQLVHRSEQKVLLESKKYSNRHKRKILDWQEAARKELEKEDLYQLQSTEDGFRVVFSLTPESEEGDSGSGKKLQLFSPLFKSEDMGEQWLTAIRELIDQEACEREGFHLLEHILLRPNDPSDLLLQLDKDKCLTNSDKYSFVVTVVLPDWPRRYRDDNYRYYVEQTFRREAPAHIYLRFCWVDRDGIQEFERAFQRWREALVKCTPDECEVNEWSAKLINWLNARDCPCSPDTPPKNDSLCAPERTEDEFERPRRDLNA